MAGPRTTSNPCITVHHSKQAHWGPMHGWSSQQAARGSWPTRRHNGHTFDLRRGSEVNGLQTSACCCMLKYHGSCQKLHDIQLRPAGW